MKIAFTGHRPDKLGGYDDTKNLMKDIVSKIHNVIISMGTPEMLIVGGALGVDTWAAQYAIYVELPYSVYVPFKGQERMWPTESQKTYHQILALASNVKYICSPGYAAWKMQKRNEAMVDDCDILIAVWNGTFGGTHNCISYAKQVGKTIIYIRV